MPKAIGQPNQDDPGHVAMDKVMHAHDITQKMWKQSTDAMQIQLMSDAGFFKLFMLLLNHPYMAMKFQACLVLRTLLTGGMGDGAHDKAKAKLNGLLVDKLFDEGIVARVTQLALSEDPSETESFSIGRRSPKNPVKNAKDEAANALVYIVKFSKRKHLHTLVDMGARDGVCLAAQKSDAAQLLFAIESASKLGFEPFDDDDLGELTLTGMDGIMKYVQLCNATENLLPKDEL